MSLKYLIFTAFSTAISISSLLASPLEFNTLAQAVQQTQSSTIEINLNELNSPYWLSIYATNTTRIQGEVRLNGNVIQSLNSPNTLINLSPYLNRGNYQLIIRGNYTPKNSSVTMQLKGKNNQVTQQTGGNGLINQVISIQVK